VTTPVYFNFNTAAAVTPSAWQAGWNYQNGTLTTASWHPNPEGSPPTRTGANHSNDATSGNRYGARMRFVGPPLAAQTISGTFRGQWSVLENAAGNNSNLAVAIQIINSSGTVQSTLLAATSAENTSATPPEIATSNTNRQFRDPSGNTSIALTSQTCSDGDRIVIEVGVREGSTSGTETFRYGGNPANAGLLPTDNTTSSLTLVEWAEFSQTFQWSTSGEDVDVSQVARHVIAEDARVDVSQVVRHVIAEIATNLDADWTQGNFTFYGELQQASTGLNLEADWVLGAFSFSGELEAQARVSGNWAVGNFNFAGHLQEGEKLREDWGLGNFGFDGDFRALSRIGFDWELGGFGFSGNFQEGGKIRGEWYVENFGFDGELERLARIVGDWKVGEFTFESGFGIARAIEGDWQLGEFGFSGQFVPVRGIEENWRVEGFGFSGGLLAKAQLLVGWNLGEFDFGWGTTFQVRTFLEGEIVLDGFGFNFGMDNRSFIRQGWTMEDFNFQQLLLTIGRLRTVQIRWEPRGGHTFVMFCPAKSTEEKICVEVDFSKGVAPGDLVVRIVRVFCDQPDMVGMNYLDDNYVYQIIEKGLSGSVPRLGVTVELRSGIRLTAVGFLPVREF
jgi:hypothetical protein